MQEYDVLREAQKICLQYKCKTYRHFDSPLSEKGKKDQLNLFSNPDLVKSYRHLPFISFDIRFRKYDRNKTLEKRIHTKVRKISLASHHDAFLLKFYANILSHYYEKYVLDKNISDVSLAYRKEKSNITGAKEVLDFVWKERNAWIIKGDFSSFFDNLNHKLLFKTVKKVLLGDISLNLRDDWYSILKYVTKYRTISKKEIYATLKPFHGQAYVDNRKKLGDYIKNGKLHLSSANRKGIPQGTAISAVLANVYMIFFDEYVKHLVKSYGGFYRRYSDDFVIILPENRCNYVCVNQIKNNIISKSENDLFLDIETDKTKLLHFVKEDGKIYKDNTKIATTFDYLGFEFNGTVVFLRSKTLYKFHYRGKKCIRLLSRNLEERAIVESDNYLQLRKDYLLKRNSALIEKATKRLDDAKKDSQKGRSVKYRRKTTILYLSSKPIKMKNMLSYAANAQKIFSEPIPGCDSIYNVYMEQKIKKQIGNFQKEFNIYKEKSICAHNTKTLEINSQ